VVCALTDERATVQFCKITRLDRISYVTGRVVLIYLGLSTVTWIVFRNFTGTPPAIAGL
jgi:hypothetical protein